MDEKKGMEMVREYSLKYYGRPNERYELLGRYLPEAMANWIELRKSIFPDPAVGGLTLREKELICTAIEIARRQPDTTLHAKLAIRAGASVKDVAEVCAICILLGGMMSYIATGASALKAAEEEHEKLTKEKK